MFVLFMEIIGQGSTILTMKEFCGNAYQSKLFLSKQFCNFRSLIQTSVKLKLSILDVVYMHNTYL